MGQKKQSSQFFHRYILHYITILCEKSGGFPITMVALYRDFPITCMIHLIMMVVRTMILESLYSLYTYGKLYGKTKISWYIH